MKLLMIDNYDSFTWNLVHLFEELGAEVAVYRNDAISVEEAEFIHEEDLPVFWSHRIAHGIEWIDTVLNTLSDTVYITFDVDFFDPSLVPATGTPEPGGGFWHDTMHFLGYVFEEKNVVGMDVVELAPIVNLHAPDFVVARLVHRCLGYKFHEW